MIFRRLHETKGITRMRLKSDVSVVPTLLTLLGASFAVRAAEPKMCDLMTRQQAGTLAGAPVGAGAEQS